MMTRENMIIGELAAQRNAALDAVVSARVELVAVAKELDSTAKHSAYMRDALADLIRSEQLRHEDVQKIMADEVFAAWYKNKYQPEV